MTGPGSNSHYGAARGHPGRGTFNRFQGRAPLQAVTERGLQPASACERLERPNCLTRPGILKLKRRERRAPLQAVTARGHLGRSTFNHFQRVGLLPSFLANRCCCGLEGRAPLNTLTNQHPYQPTPLNTLKQ